MTTSAKLALGIILKIIGCFLWAWRFILLKRIDNKFDEICDMDDQIDRHDFKKIREEIPPNELFFKNKKIPYLDFELTMWKHEFYQYLTIPLSLLFDTGSIFYLSLVLYSVFNIFSIVFYELMLKTLLNYHVNQNEWIVITCMIICTIFLAFFSPNEGSLVPDMNQNQYIHGPNISKDPGSWTWIIFILIIKFFTYSYLQTTMKYYLQKKDNEELSDLWQPRPMSFYNLMGPVHLACNNIIFAICLKMMSNVLQLGSMGSIIAGIFAITFGGFSFSWFCAHGYLDMISELHSATLYPIMMLLTSLFTTFTGIICFGEIVDNILGFALAAVAMFIILVTWVMVMEHNYKFDEMEKYTPKSSTPDYFFSQMQNIVRSATNYNLNEEIEELSLSEEETEEEEFGMMLYENKPILLKDKNSGENEQNEDINEFEKDLKKLMFNAPLEIGTNNSFEEANIPIIFRNTPPSEFEKAHTNEKISLMNKVHKEEVSMKYTKMKDPTNEEETEETENTEETEETENTEESEESTNTEKIEDLTNENSESVDLIICDDDDKIENRI